MTSSQDSSVLNSHRLHRKSFATLLLLTITLLGVFPLDVVLPSFPALSTQFQTPMSNIALSVSLFAIGVAFSQLLIGPLSDVIGRKGLLLAGLGVAMIGAIGCVLSTNFSGFLFFRVIQALGCGCFVLSQALIQDLFEEKERDRLRILLVTTGGVMISVSPLLGTGLQHLTNWQGSFLVFLALTMLVFLWACFFLEDVRPTPSAPARRIYRAYRLVFGDASFVAYWLISSLAFACHFSFIVVSPILFMDRLGFSDFRFSLILLIYGVAYVIGGALAGFLHKRISPDTQIFLGFCLIAFAGLILLTVSRQFGLEARSLLLTMILCTTGITLARPAATSKAMAMFPENAGTAASAGSLLIFITGGLISALINLGDTYQENLLAFAFMVSGGIGLALNIRLKRQTRSSHSS